LIFVLKKLSELLGVNWGALNLRRSATKYNLVTKSAFIRNTCENSYIDFLA